MTGGLIGRKAEIKILETALSSNEAEMVAVIGRRRVGKTFLVKETYKKRIVFSITGVRDAPLREQLGNFTYQLNEHADATTPFQRPDTWQEAFQMLISFLKKRTGQEKPVVFFDELPWLASPRSGFLRGLGFFWNSWAVDQNIVVVICGSVASWMIKKVVNHKGGLHNRITQRIFLAPFDLLETEAYLKSRNVHLDRYQVVQLYMATGGVPHYLKEVKPGKSASQNINAICFSKNGLLRHEFPNLYPALFSNAEQHIAVVRALGAKRTGLTRKSIVAAAGIPEGGTAQRVLEELEQSGFISVYPILGKKKKERLYRLTDEYSLFYLRFMDGRIIQETEIWDKLSQTPTYKSWSGYAFENVCLKHVSAIKGALGISGIYSEVVSFQRPAKGDLPGVQIDLVIDRSDHVVNLFEIKFYNAPFILSKDYANKLRQKAALFKAYSKTNKQVFMSMVSSFGLMSNEHSIGLIHHNLTIDDLFG